MKDVFISYAHEDMDSATRLAELLEASGLSVSWDPELRAGQDFAKEIDQILQQVRCVIVLWSANSVDSRWVRAEANEGLRLGKSVPAALDESRPPLVFRGIQTAQLEAPGLAAGSDNVDKLIADVWAIVEQDTAGQPEKERSPLVSPYPWRYPIAIAAAVGAVLALMEASDLPANALDGLTGLMASWPVRLPPLATELGLTVAAVAILLFSGWQLHNNRFRKKYWLVPSALGAFIATASIYTWIERWKSPAPDHLTGKVIAAQWKDMSIVALDALSRPISFGAVPVSTENGEFGMRLLESFADRPRTLSLSKAGCVEFRIPLRWQQWKSRKLIVVSYQCEPQS